MVPWLVGWEVHCVMLPLTNTILKIYLSGGFLLIVPTVNMIFFFRVAAIYGNKPKCKPIEFWLPVTGSITDPFLSRGITHCLVSRYVVPNLYASIHCSPNDSGVHCMQANQVYCPYVTWLTSGSWLCSVHPHSHDYRYNPGGIELNQHAPSTPGT